MTFSQQKALAENGLFRSQVKMAIIKASLDIIGETPASPVNVTKDKVRHDLAVNVLADIENDPGIWVVRFAFACAANNNLNADPLVNTDSDVQFTVNSIWNDLAGVEGKDSLIGI